ncbi:transmembrane protein 150C-like isoform X1 [Takifugu rubripes]|uniref:transmembrane protein 150C-like isoform X1 n=1 Tax=Takifugu rubripes TaxID=31033 RepID=UPI001145AFDA|nr:transmembrane protein 150C-like isoform X1 [Takifugu rubripes]
MQGVRRGEMSSCSSWAAMPILYSGSVVTGLWLVYFMAIIDEQIAPLGSTYSCQSQSFQPPYISMAGNYPPASCILGQVMNLAGYGGAVLFCYRFVQVKSRLKEVWLNVSALVANCINCFGMTLVGNFQYSADPTVHNIGAWLMFVVGAVACWLETWITIKIDIKNEGMKIGIIRALLSGVITICMVLFTVLVVQGDCTSAVPLEWALVMFMFLFYGTFAVEFRHSRFETTCTDTCPSTKVTSCRPSQQ